MSFEIKYDRDGQPIKASPTQQQQAAQPEPVAQPETEAPEPEQLEVSEQEAEPQEETQEVAPEPVKVAPKTKAPQQSWADLRAQKEQAERERDEAMRILRAMESQKPQKQAQPEHEDIPDFSMNDDDLVEGKHVKKIVQELREVRKEMNSYKQQSHEMTAETKLKMQYPDFDKVVNNENLAALTAAEPEIAASLHYNPDLFTKAVAAYKAIKKSGIYVEDTFVADRQAAQKNAAKPRPLSSLSPQQGESPLTKANAFAQGLTPELQKQMLKEMNDARKNL